MWSHTHVSVTLSYHLPQSPLQFPPRPRRPVSPAASPSYPLDHWAWPTKAKWRGAVGEGCVLGRASSQALRRVWLLGAQWFIAAMAQENDARKETAAEGRHKRTRSSILSAGAGASARMRMRGALAPHPPAGRPFTLATAARQRRARGLGADRRDLRDGTGRAAAAEVAGLKGSSGFSLSSSDRFGPEGLVHRHGLAESKRGRSAGPRGWAGRAGLRGGGRGRASDPPDPTRSDPTRADLSARRERWPRPGPRMTCLALGRDCGAETGSRTRVPEPLRRR